MPITFSDGVFHLQTRACSYVLSVLPSGHVAHLYFGSPLREANGTHLLGERRGRAFSPEISHGFSLDLLPQEAPAFGGGDFRSPLVEIQSANGATAGEFIYHSHRIFAGKLELAGLPSFYVEDDAEAQTLELELLDAVSGAALILSYTAFEAGAITRSVRVENRSASPLQLRRVLSASVDFPTSDYHFVHLSGAWARERDIVRAPLRAGVQSIESRRGASSHVQNPFFALCSPDANEASGEVWGFNLVYSGNHLGQVEVDQFGVARVQTGINPFDFGWQLLPGEAFQAPEAVMVYSAQGFGSMSRAFHALIRTRLCRGEWRDKPRPVLVNSWEASYFDIDEETIVRLGEAASAAGIELLVMDDGWFGQRDDDTTSLGDWTPHPIKFPHGLSSLANRLNALGLQFGLWLEPEMVSPDSDLYRAHPDWCLHTPDRRRTEARNQLILDLSRADVQDYLIETLSKVLSDANIGYIKWDMNRHMTEVGSALLPPQQQRETAHRYILGLYRVLGELTRRFPKVLFESCSGGGGRFDLGLLPFMPQVWGSDNTDAVARLRIQEGTLLAYPSVSMGAHVSDVPNHQVHRTTPFSTRAAVALAGTFGYELDLGKLSPEDQAATKAQVAFFKEHRALIHGGDYYALQSVFRGAQNESAWMFVAPDQNAALVTWVQTLAVPNAPLARLKLAGLNPARDYELTPVELSAPSADTPAPLVLGGDALMHAGLQFQSEGDFSARVWVLKAR